MNLRQGALRDMCWVAGSRRKVRARHRLASVSTETVPRGGSPIAPEQPEPPAHPSRPEQKPDVQPPAERPVPDADEPTPESADNEI